MIVVYKLYKLNVKAFPTLGRWWALKSAFLVRYHSIRTAVKSGHLIPADDTEALMAALGLEQVGWQHGSSTNLVDDFFQHWDRTKFVRELLPTDCADCVPVYKPKKGNVNES